MLTDEDIEKGYPAEKEQTAIFQLIIMFAALLIGMFLLGQFLRDLGIFVSRLIIVK